MPRYSTTAATFQPISLADRLKPMEQYAETYDKNNELLNKIGEEMGVVEPIVTSLSNDNPLKQSYNDYMSQLSKSADRVMSGDLGAIGDANKLTRKFASVYRPLATAKDTLDTWKKEQQALRAKDNSVVFDMDASDPGMVDFITKNPNATYKMASGDDVTKRVEDAMKNFKDQYRTQLRYGMLPDWVSTADRLFLERDESKGLTEADINDIIMHPEDYPMISSILESAVNASGVGDWGSPAAQSKMLNAAVRGLAAGMGKDNIVTQKGPGMTDYQRQQAAIGWSRANALNNKNSGSRTSGSGGGSKGREYFNGVTEFKDGAITFKGNTRNDYNKYIGNKNTPRQPLTSNEDIMAVTSNVTNTRKFGSSIESLNKALKTFANQFDIPMEDIVRVPQLEEQTVGSEQEATSNSSNEAPDARRVAFVNKLKDAKDKNYIKDFLGLPIDDNLLNVDFKIKFPEGVLVDMTPDGTIVFEQLKTQVPGSISNDISSEEAALEAYLAQNAVPQEDADRLPGSVGQFVTGTEVDNN